MWRQLQCRSKLLERKLLRSEYGLYKSASVLCARTLPCSLFLLHATNTNLQCHKSSNAHGCFACRLKKEEQKMAKKVEETLRSPLLKDREKRYGTFKAAELVALLHSAGVRVSNKLSKGKCRVELERVVNGEECDYASRVDVSKCPARQESDGAQHKCSQACLEQWDSAMSVRFLW